MNEYGLPESDVKYEAYLCSSAPNNECALCSNLPPKSIVDEEGIFNASDNGFSAYCKCPSCKRIAKRFFLPENSGKVKQVPADRAFVFPSHVWAGHFSAADWVAMSYEERYEFLSTTKPLQIRKDLDWEARNEKLKEYFEREKASKKSTTAAKKEVFIKKPSSRAGKTVSRKIKF